MHELSIAESILDIVRQYVPEPARTPVRALHVKIGAQSGVSPLALDFAFNAVIADTPLAGAVLHIEEVPYRLRCENCDADFESSDGLAVCPDCGSISATVLSGMEMRVDHIDVEDGAADE
jgi:hydrogenase nickel incorporation protein HypA/HybF